MREQANQNPHQNQQQMAAQQMPLPSFLQDDNGASAAGESAATSSWAQELSSLIDSSTNTSNSANAPKDVAKDLPSFASFDIGSGTGGGAKQEVPARPRPTLDEEI